MPLLDEVLDANRRALKADQGTFIANRRLCIVTCIDPRLTRWFSFALGIERGHAVAIRVPGAQIPPGSDLMRSLAASVYVNGCEEVLVMPHTDCGVARVGPDEVRQVMAQRGVTPESVPTADLAKFFGLVKDLRAATLETVRAIREAPFLPRMAVHAAQIDVATGELTLWESGY